MGGGGGGTHQDIISPDGDPFKIYPKVGNGFQRITDELGKQNEKKTTLS